MPRGRRARPSTSSDISYNHPPSLTPEGRENQVIAAAFDLAEKQIREGTASAQVITHFLKLGSQRDRLERDLLAEKTRLTTAKAEAIDRGKEQEELFNKALKAMRRYSGNDDEDEEEFYDEDY